MDCKDRNFGKQFKEYREQYLDNKQQEAAERLSISSSASLNYEMKNHDLTPGMLAEIKRTFDIPDDYFLAMILGKPLRDVKPERQDVADTTNEIQTHFPNQFIEEHRGLLEENNELREVIAIASSLSAKQCRIYSNSIKSNIAVIKSLVDKKQQSTQYLHTPEKES